MEVFMALKDSRKDLRPLLIKAGDDSYLVKVAVSPTRHKGDKDGYLLPEFNDLVKEFDITATSAAMSPKNTETPRSELEAPKAFRSLERNDHEQEIRHLQSMVQMLQERERNLEVQLLEFYGVKEQEATVTELQNRLKINNMEAKFLALKIESLQADNQRLQEQVADHARVVAELDATRAKMKLLKKKFRSETEQNREKILALKKNVSRLQELELKAAAADSEVQLKLKRLDNLETEAGELRKSNSRLCKENSELASQLESTQILANSVQNDPATKALRGLCDRLRHENESLSKEVEQLQADRCTDVEELVYLRWVNACLRYELRNFQHPHGKTVARDLSKSLSPKSEEKAKKLILEYASTEGMGDKGTNALDMESDRWSFSQGSYVTDSGSFDESPPPSKTVSSKAKIFKKLRRLIRGKDVHHSDHGTSGEKNERGQGSDSPIFRLSSSTMTDAMSDMPFNSSRTPSPYPTRYSARHSSLDIPRRSSPKKSHNRQTETSQSQYSDAGSSYGYNTRFSSCGGSTSDSSLENLLQRGSPLENLPQQGSFSSEKSDVVKFAEALKDTGSSSSRMENEDGKGRAHRKAVSLGSFQPIHRATSEGKYFLAAWSLCFFSFMSAER
ncbi:hypothetical protein Tsubulata_013222 [Turnera subulata]|uniref:Protein CHUP1, chloroplastic n=1 Tax=Turnera subulata TaxID=218843 RepID=A0A9Q0FM67_9ROSI|nr:hypothetical protein Tsubulata_013222 [Turnera subulata]